MSDRPAADDVRTAVANAVRRTYQGRNSQRWTGEYLEPVMTALAPFVAELDRLRAALAAAGGAQTLRDAADDPGVGDPLFEAIAGTWDHWHFCDRHMSDCRTCQRIQAQTGEIIAAFRQVRARADAIDAAAGPAVSGGETRRDVAQRVFLAARSYYLSGGKDRVDFDVTALVEALGISNDEARGYITDFYRAQLGSADPAATDPQRAAQRPDEDGERCG